MEGNACSFESAVNIHITCAVNKVAGNGDVGPFIISESTKRGSITNQTVFVDGKKV